MKIKKLFLGMALSVLVSLSATGCDSASGNASGAEELSDVKVIMGEYKGLEVEVLTTEVTEEELQSRIDSYLEGFKVEDASNKTVEEGETVNVDYKGYDNGVAFEGGTAEDQEITVGAGGFIDGFEEGMIGAKVGETITVDATFPDNYTANDELSGKTVQFEVTVNYIYKLPELTDKVVEADETSAYSDCKTAEELKAALTEEIKADKQSSSDNAKINTVINMVINNADFEGLAQKHVQSYYEEVYGSYESEASMYSIDMDTYAAFKGYTLEEFKDLCYEMAEANVKANLIFDKVAKDDKISITDEEFETTLSGIVSQYAVYGYTEEDVLETYGGKAEIRKILTREKVRDYIVDSAVVTAEVEELKSIEYKTTTSRQEVEPETIRQVD